MEQERLTGLVRKLEKYRSKYFTEGNPREKRAYLYRLEKEFEDYILDEDRSNRRKLRNVQDAIDFYESPSLDIEASLREDIVGILANTLNILSSDTKKKKLFREPDVNYLRDLYESRDSLSSPFLELEEWTWKFMKAAGKGAKNIMYLEEAAVDLLDTIEWINTVDDDNWYINAIRKDLRTIAEIFRLDHLDKLGGVTKLVTKYYDPILDRIDLMLSNMHESSVDHYSSKGLFL